MKPLVSVVMPVYNVEKYLMKSVKSVCDQTYKNLEIILVDDGATDSSGRLCDQLAAQDDRIRVIHKANGGLSDARNAGMDAAHGAYICFFDSDDWVEPDTISYAVDILERSDVPIVAWGYDADFADEDENVVQTVSYPAAPGQCRKNENSQLLAQRHNLGILGYAWNKLYRLDFLREGGWYFEKGTSLVEDILFNSEVLCRANSVIFTEKIFTHYMQRPRTTLGNKYYDNFFDLKIRACQAREAILLHFGMSSSKVESTLNDQYFGAVKSCVRMIARSNLTDGQKKIKLREIRKHSEFNEAMKRYNRKVPKDILVASLLQLKMYSVLLLLLR